MTAEPDNLVLQHLDAIRVQQDVHTESLIEIIQRLGDREVQGANISNGLDRIDAKLDRIDGHFDRIERPLGLG
jgi:hypothetical protein